MFVDGQVSTNPTKIQSESIEQLCKNNIDKSVDKKYLDLSASSYTSLSGINDIL